jgi:hypothetical protein
MNHEPEQQAAGLVDQILEEGQARVIVTYAGQTGDLPDTVHSGAAHDDVRRMVQEALRTGGVNGIPATPDADLTDFIVDRAPARGDQPLRLLLRPKTAFGAP